MQEWISKKELLALTGISYGQLYRWKRERLIPDHWFEKRSAFTGQETFFPRDLILERIRFILEHKDGCSLSQMMEMLTPSPSRRSFAPDSFAGKSEFEPGARIVRRVASCDTLDYRQALAALIVSEVPGLSEEERALFAQCLLRWPFTEDTDSGIALMRRGGVLFPLYLKPDARLDGGDDATVLYHLPLNRLAMDYQRRVDALP